MRKYLADMNPVEAMEFVEDKIKKTLNNEGVSNFYELLVFGLA